MRKITVAETKTFRAKARKLLSEDETTAIIDTISANPECGDLIRGTGGVRKVRFAIAGSGKSGGVRVIYYFFNETVPVYLLTLFAKNEKENLGKDERNELRVLTARLAKLWRSK